jgi:RNA polymerase sigma factor (sigma-70 family)
MRTEAELLEDWRGGDAAALGELLARLLPFLREQARGLLGKDLRRRMGSEDVVQDTVLDFLRSGPRFLPSAPEQLRGLLARIVANTIADHGKWWQAARRRLSAETALASTVLGGTPASQASPAQLAIAADDRERLRLGLELVTSRDRELLLWHDFEQQSFAHIGHRLALAEEAARAAYRRAKIRLAERLVQLQRGDFASALAAANPGE